MNKFSGSSGMVDPYAAIDFNNKGGKQKGKQKKAKKEDDFDEYPPENLDEFG